MPTTPLRGWPYPAYEENPYYDTIVSTFEAQDADVGSLMTRTTTLETNVRSVPLGGTGQSTLTSGAYLKGAGTSAVAFQATPIPVSDGGTGASSLAGAGIVNGSGVVGQVAYFSGATTVAGSSRMLFDASLGQLSIASPNAGGLDTKVGLLLDRGYDTVGDTQEIVWGGGTGMTGNRAGAIKMMATAGGEAGFIFTAQTASGDGYNNEVLRVTGAGGVLATSLTTARYFATSYNGSSTQNLRRTRGTVGSEAALLSSDVIGLMNYAGHGGTGSFIIGGQISATATQNWSGTAAGTVLGFKVAPDNATALVEGMRLGPGYLLTTASRVVLEGYAPVYDIDVGVDGMAAQTMQITMGSVAVPNTSQLEGLRITGTLTGSDNTTTHHIYGLAFTIRNDATVGGGAGGDATRARGIIGSAITSGPGSVRGVHAHGLAEGSSTGVVNGINAQVTPVATTAVCRAIQVGSTGATGITDGVFLDSNLGTNAFRRGFSSEAAHFTDSAIYMLQGDVHGRIKWTDGTYLSTPASGTLEFKGAYSTNHYLVITGSEALAWDKGIIIRTHEGTTTPTAVAASSTAGNVFFQAHSGGGYTTLCWLRGIVAPSWDGYFEFVTRYGGGAGTRMTLFAGLQMGQPTGGDKGHGSINCQADVWKNNSAYGNPAYVFEHWATGRITQHADHEGASEYTGLRPIAEVESLVRQHHELPLMGRHKDGGLFQRGDLFLASLEEAYLYLFQHEARMKKLEDALQELGR